MFVDIGYRRETDLPQLALACRRPASLESAADGWKKQRGQNGDDRNDHQQFNKSEPGTKGPPLHRRTSFTISGLLFRGMLNRDLIVIRLIKKSI
jgi:hypothetical protein